MRPQRGLCSKESILFQKKSRIDGNIDSIIKETPANLLLTDRAMQPTATKAIYLECSVVIRFLPLIIAFWQLLWTVQTSQPFGRTMNTSNALYLQFPGVPMSPALMGSISSTGSTTHKKIKYRMLIIAPKILFKYHLLPRMLRITAATINSNKAT